MLVIMDFCWPILRWRLLQLWQVLRALKSRICPIELLLQLRYISVYR